MASKGFEPDVKVRTKEYRIGCIGAGMIMAECHLAAYKEAGFPGGGDRLAHQGQRREGREALGHPDRPRHAGAADRGHAKSRSSTSPFRPTSSRR